MFNPFIELISGVIDLYSLVIFIWVIMSLLLQFDVINRYNLLVKRIFTALSQLVDPGLEPFRRLQRKLLPRVYALDLSPVGLLLTLQFIKSALFAWFWSIPRV